MNAKLQIVGHYQVDGSKITNPSKSFDLRLSQRKTTTSTKPPLFMVAKSKGGTFDTGKKDQYISSIYNVEGQTFSKIDYNGVSYQFEIIEDHAEIRHWDQMAMYLKCHL
jgi:hypothetical protein